MEALMTQAASTSEVPVTPYAVASDFCRIFAEEMNGLYQLSFLLTADPGKAEQCFVSGLGDCAGANRVFREWARSWARRTIVQNAIRTIQPTREHSALIPDAGRSHEVEESDSRAKLAAVLGLKTFERFVFVMSVLEQYSDQDCKTLLGCSRQDIVRARVQALKKMAASDGAPAPDVAAGAGGLPRLQRLVAKTA
jgi:DNA-directed RNA polymerase specialized sigma24 family protein